MARYTPSRSSRASCASARSSAPVSASRSASAATSASSNAATVPERPNERQFFADAPPRDGQRKGPPQDRNNGLVRAKTGHARIVLARSAGAASAASRQRRAGTAPLRHDREKRRFDGGLAVRQAARAQARREEVAASWRGGRPCSRDAARQVALARTLLQDPISCHALRRKGTLSCRRSVSPTSRTPAWRRAWC